MTWHHFIGWNKHAWQVYVALNEKYGQRDYWCKYDRISEGKIQNLKFHDIKSKHP